jgi:hypothetical protein
MKVSLVEKVMQTFMLSVLFLVTLSISSWNMLDPFNLPKLTILAPLSFSIGGLVLFVLMKKEIRDSLHVNFKLLLVPILFILNLFVITAFDSRDFSTKLYGTWGRSTGLLAYLSLTILLVASIVFSSQVTVNKVLKCFFFTCSILAIYGTFQSFGLDFFNYNSQTTSQVFSTLGNPNFHSSFMGFGALAGSLYLFSRKLKIELKLVFVGLVLLCLLNVYESSAQGFFVWILGIIFGSIMFLFVKKRYLFFWCLLCLSLSGLTLLLMGFFNFGPLGPYVFNLAVQVRGFYWAAGLKMMMNHPTFGVGLDGYGDWYRRSRSSSAYSYDSKLTSDSAHNLILDIGASGGLPLLTLYLGIVLLAMASIVKHVKTAHNVEWSYIILCSIWFGYQVQSMISINQIGLGVWGWIITGLIIGYPKSMPPSTSLKKSAYLKNLNNSKLSSLKLPISSAFIFFIVGLLISLPAYTASTRYFRALQTSSPTEITKAAYIKPFERHRFFFSIAILSQNGYHTESESILRFATDLYPNSFDLWSAYLDNPSVGQAQLDLAEAQIKRLDPLNVNQN